MDRRFGEEVPGVPTVSYTSSTKISQNTGDDILSWIRTNEIGADTKIQTAFGCMQMVYCDYAASARAIGPIEEYIQKEVLPTYGNTHSTVTVSAEQTTLFVHEARQEVRAMVGAGDQDAVIFTGSGATSAVNLFVHLVGVDDDVVVVHSDREHHSHLLPWRHAAAEAFKVNENENGRLCLSSLKTTLETVREKHPKKKIIGAFSAASNVTGLLTDIQAVTKLLKSFGALSVWDMASAAPYVDVQVNGLYSLDAVFFSGHKFVGGTSTPGVLVIKRILINKAQPQRIGGGTVFFVSSENEWYLKEEEHREEGGTPDAIGIIRLALAVKLKRSVTERVIQEQDSRIVRRFVDGLTSIPEVVLLGPASVEDRLPIFSFLIKDTKSGLFLHHNLVSVLLNDLFGIQSRAGCACAGPYAQQLLGIDEELANVFVSVLREADGLDRVHLRRAREYSPREVLRPGFTRISLPYFFTNEQIDYVIDAIRFVALYASDFMHMYVVIGESGEWHNLKQRVFQARKWLGHVQFGLSGMTVGKKNASVSPLVPMKDAIAEAHKLREEALEQRSKAHVADGRQLLDTPEAVRWFILPIEVHQREIGREVQYGKCPFQPKEYVVCDFPKDASLSSFESVSISNARDADKDDLLDEGVPSPIVDLGKEKSEEIGGECPTNGCDLPDPTSCSTTECLPCEQARIEIDLSKDEELDEQDNKEFSEMQDWNKRVIVRMREITKVEEKGLPWVIPPLPLYKKMTEAIHQLNMIQEGDRVLVCLSGGKDSLSLLHMLHFYQQRCIKHRSTNFKLGALTVDPGSSAYNPRPLIDYCRSLNIEYFYEEQDIIGLAKSLPNVRSICGFCSRLRRGRMSAAAQHHGYNVLAMGHHLDDVAESFFIAAFQNGALSTMKAHYTSRAEHNLRVIRPLIYVREKELREFAESNHLPIIAENCPSCFNQATERYRIKQLLAGEELVFPELFHSLRSALKPLLLVDSACTDEMRANAVINIVGSNKGRIKKEQNGS